MARDDYEWLRGERQIRPDGVERVLGVLGLTVAIGDDA